LPGLAPLASPLEARLDFGLSGHRTTRDFC
jgi:hypothetical protein